MLRSLRRAAQAAAPGSCACRSVTPAAGVTVAAALAFALWFGAPLGNHHGGMSADAQSNFEDLDIVASSDEGSGDAMEMLQDDIEFYNWAEKAASSGPSA